METLATILHAVLDAFYASVEQLLNPHLRGKPIAVGGGVVLAASYEAKAFGVRGGMPGRRARELCPQLIFVGGNFTEYQRLGDAAIAILGDYTPLVERISIDEAFADVAGCTHLFGSSVLILLATALPHSGHAADVIGNSERSVERDSEPRATMPVTIAGRASVIDGRTLWFPHRGLMVRLASIDACALPQWSYDPRRHGDGMIPKPVPCGPLAKAWLKRSVSNAPVKCTVVTHEGGGALLGRCTARGRDLAREMLRVGWARTISPAPADYLTWQTYAMSARHGMWATYVLDMDEWRAKAVDRTAARRPIADFNLLAERDSEISPPFEDALRRPKRTDR